LLQEERNPLEHLQTFGVCTHLPSNPQESSVQASPSSQTLALKWQVPWLQVVMVQLFGATHFSFLTQPTLATWLLVKQEVSGSVHAGTFFSQAPVVLLQAKEIPHLVVPSQVFGTVKHPNLASQKLFLHLSVEVQTTGVFTTPFFGWQTAVLHVSTFESKMEVISWKTH
jgi:hypothetical protein